jgi:hypothetical protein
MPSHCLRRRLCPLFFFVVNCQNQQDIYKTLGPLSRRGYASSLDRPNSSSSTLSASWPSATPQRINQAFLDIKWLHQTSRVHSLPGGFERQNSTTPRALPIKSTKIDVKLTTKAQLSISQDFILNVCSTVWTQPPALLPYQLIIDTLD